jgi:hypothetical protein
VNPQSSYNNGLRCNTIDSHTVCKEYSGNVICGVPLSSIKQGQPLLRGHCQRHGIRLRAVSPASATDRVPTLLAFLQEQQWRN